jgi:hypothetical protein
MTTNTNTRRTRKTAQTADAPAPTPAPVQATDTNTGTDKAAPTTQAPAYVIPDWSADTDQAAYVESVGAAYRNADKGTKAAMRAAWAKFQSDALNDLDMGKLALVRDVNAVLVTSRPTVEVDPADAYVIHLAALESAREIALNAFKEAHGADAYAALVERVNGGLDDQETEARDALATKLATVKSGNRRTGPQRSVEAHIRSALEAAPEGTILTCAQIHNHRSDAYGPDEAPSVGAIGAAHGREMDGIESTENASKVKGFRLAA